MIALWIVLGVVVLLGLALIVSYNRFVAQRNVIRASFADIETELRRRYDLIPNLVETVRGYAGHERETLDRVTQARAAAAGTTGSPAAQAAAEGPLIAALRQLFAVAEAYPDLKANQNFLALQGELAATEDRIQARRSLYNEAVRGYNERVQSFPSNFVARTFGFKEEEFFEVEEAIRPEVERAPRVDFTRETAGPAASPGPAGPTAPPEA